MISMTHSEGEEWLWQYDKTIVTALSVILVIIPIERLIFDVCVYWNVIYRNNFMNKKKLCINENFPTSKITFFVT